ncbi:hypothetical protein JKP88DRAFT_273437 [Tribonema minus]|uniref:BTB domain-containing protein n=1 Tax=Tribonema minus TaxID=303371 RepID=A0A835YTL1_9STRA|nr:hypothetical protein JKP88DRAFT_273437 [Tribonema minus]
MTFGTTGGQALQATRSGKRKRKESEDSEQESICGDDGREDGFKFNESNDGKRDRCKNTIESHSENDGEQNIGSEQEGGNVCETGVFRQLWLHAVVLMVNSSVLEARLCRWTSAQRPVRLYIPLDSEEETMAFEDMLWCIYHDALPDEEIMTPHRAIHIMLAADRFDVPAAAQQCIAWLESQGSFTLDEALALFAAPASVQQLFPSALEEHALSALLAAVGDLEVAMNDANARASLLGFQSQR